MKMKVKPRVCYKLQFTPAWNYW